MAGKRTAMAAKPLTAAGDGRQSALIPVVQERAGP